MTLRFVMYYMNMLSLLREYQFYQLNKAFKKVRYSDMQKHSYVSWKSGSGKSEILKSLFYLLKRRTAKKRSASLILIDPHGDLAKEIIRLHSFARSDRLIYVQPNRRQGLTPVINPFTLKKPTEQQVDYRTQHLVGAFKELLPNAQFSHNMEAILYPCIATLIRKGNASLPNLQAFMDDSRNIDWVRLGLKSPYQQERAFFKHDFQQPIYRLTKASLQTKLQTLLSRPSFYNLVTGQNTLEISSEMQKGSVLIFNLAKGQLGIETSQIFGRLLLAMIQSIAQSRSHIPVQYRKDCFVFIDECHNYIATSMDVILKEARKFGIYLVMANQNVNDIQPSRLLNNVLNNTDVKIIGKNGNKSMQTLSREIGLTSQQMHNLKLYEFMLQSWNNRSLLKNKRVLHLPRFQMHQNDYQQQKDRIIKQYYKPIKPLEFKEKEERPKFALE